MHHLVTFGLAVRAEKSNAIVVCSHCTTHLQMSTVREGLAVYDIVLTRVFSLASSLRLCVQRFPCAL